PGRALGRLIFIVALPFETAIAEVAENMAREKIERLRCGRLLRYRRVPEDGANLDHTISRVDAHEGLSAGNLAGRLVDDGVEERVRRSGGVADPFDEILFFSRGMLAQPAKPLIAVQSCRYFKERSAVADCIQSFQPNITSL